MNSRVREYLITALWSSTDNSNEQGGDPPDKNYDVEDVDESAVKQAEEDCDNFMILAAERVGDILKEFDEATLMHDFWLTRNRHGAGFWDGDYPDVVGKELTEISHTFGTVDLYVGDDGKVYGN